MLAAPRDDIRPQHPVVRLADDKRQRTIARLSDAFARDVIAVEEFERRVEAVYRASERTELEAVTRDAEQKIGDVDYLTTAEKREIAGFQNARKNAAADSVMVWQEVGVLAVVLGGVPEDSLASFGSRMLRLSRVAHAADLE